MNTPTSAVSMRIFDITPRPRQFHWYQLILLILHLGAQWVVWSQIDSAGWAPHTGFLPILAICFTVITALIIWAGYDDAISLYGALIVVGSAFICWQLEPTVIADVSSTLGPEVAGRLTGYADIVSEVALHGIRWWRLTMQGTSAHDMVLFVAALALLCLVITITTAWIIYRMQLVWVGIISLAVPILVNHAFVPQSDDTILMVFVCISILMVVVNHIGIRQHVWQFMHIDYPATTPLRVLWQAILLLVPVLVITMLLPLPPNNEHAYAAWQAMRSPFTTVRTSWETLFGNGGVDVAGSFSQVAVSVAGPRPRNEQTVLRVQTNNPDYLRVTSFDWYTGTGWQRRAAADTVTVLPGTPIPNPNRGAIVVSSRITLTRPRNDNFLMSIGIPHAFGVGAQAIALSGLQADSNSLFAVQSDIIQNVDTTYTVTSLLSQANENDLRRASPAAAAINAVYVPLPDTIPARITDLAQRIVTQAAATTQYDQALAIQGYLRQLTYDEDRARPPTTTDWVDYFLFESRRGYCDDFATAMVVLLRTQGIPARLVQGYVLADRDPIRGDFVVRESLAHSWVEVYFSEFGWQRFEPTPTGYTRVPDRTAPADALPTVRPTSGPANTAVDDVRPTPTRDLSEFEPAVADNPVTPQPLSWWWYVGMVCLLLGGCAGVGYVWWQHLTTVQRHDLTYRLVWMCIRGAGVPVFASTTPNELAQLTAIHLPTVATAVTAICDVYNEVHYAQRMPDDWPVISWWVLVQTCARYRWQHRREL